MTWVKGFNFRGTAGAVVDGANETYSIGGVYPETRNGVTFGWTVAATDVHDKVGSADRRLMGTINRVNSAGTQITFRVDLPCPGAYIVRLALGDLSYIQSYQRVDIYDNLTSVLSI